MTEITPEEAHALAVKYAASLREAAADALLDHADACNDPELEHTGERPDLHDAECEVNANMLAAVLDDWGMAHDDVVSLRRQRDDLLASNNSLLERARTAEKEVERCHQRLEIDQVRYFYLNPETGVEETATKNIPMSERVEQTDGIECRDDTIRLLEENRKKLLESRDAAHSQIRELEEALEPFARDIDAFSDLSDEKHLRIFAEGMGWRTARAVAITFGDIRRAAGAMSSREKL